MDIHTISYCLLNRVAMPALQESVLPLACIVDSFKRRWLANVRVAIFIMYS